MLLNMHQMHQRFKQKAFIFKGYRKGLLYFIIFLEVKFIDENKSLPIHHDNFLCYSIELTSECVYHSIHI